MPEFEKVKTEEELEEELEIQIRKFFIDMDRINRVAQRIPANNFIGFDLQTFLLWKNDNK